MGLQSRPGVATGRLHLFPLIFIVKKRMNFNSILSAVVFLLSSFHHVTSRGVPEAEYEAVPVVANAAPASSYYPNGGRDGDAVFEVLRRSAGGELGIKDALQYIDALDKHYGKFTSRFGKRSMPRVDSRRQAYQNYLKGL